MPFFTSGDPESGDRMRSLMGPGQVDEQVRQTILTAWMSLPEDKRAVAEVERVVRQILERALENFREDAKTFGWGELRRGTSTCLALERETFETHKIKVLL